MDYIYGKLNELVDVTQPRVESADPCIIAAKRQLTTLLQLDRNKLVQFKRIPYSYPVEYQLFGYNLFTKEFDIPLGEKVTFTSSDQGEIISSALIGNQEVGAQLGANGRLILNSIPISAITDSDYYIPEGETSPQIYETIIDGND